MLAQDLLGSLQGDDAVFLPMVFLHVISALAGFGSVGFAGTYASRAAHLPAFAGLAGRAADAGERDAGDKGAAGPGSAERAEVASAADGTGTVGPPPAPGEGSARSPGAKSVEDPSGEAVRAGAALVPLTQEDPEIEELTRYFERPARFWKALFLVPVFGLLALWAQPRTKGLDQIWTIGALLVWAAAILVVAGLVVPALNQMKTILVADPPEPVTPGTAGAHRARLAQAGSMASRGAVFCDLLFIVALALMIWQP